jgi:hypothetical protein
MPEESTFGMTVRHNIFRMRVIIFPAIADQSCPALRTCDVGSLLHGETYEDSV